MDGLSFLVGIQSKSLPHYLAYTRYLFFEFQEEPSKKYYKSPMANPNNDFILSWMGVQ